MTHSGHKEDAHPVESLPWYLSGTLSRAERDEVAVHLEACTQCRAELDSLRLVRSQVRAVADDGSAPTPAVRRRVMERIHEERRAPRAWTRAARALAGASVTDRAAGFFRSLLAPKWAPAAAVCLIVLQAGALSWLIQQPEDAQVTTRGIDAQVARVQVTFLPTAPEREIRALLREIHGRIVDGPSTDGVYLVEVPAGDAARLAAKVDVLRGRTDLVKLAEPVSP